MIWRVSYALVATLGVLVAVTHFSSLAIGFIAAALIFRFGFRGDLPHALWHCLVAAAFASLLLA